MKEARYFYVTNASQENELPQEEATHALRVLRLKEGDELFLMDGDGCFYEARVSMANNKHCFYTINKAIPQQRTWQGHIHLAIAPTKMMERMEWMVEKAVEVGVDEISFLDCQFSERHTIRVDRIEKIMISAMKQSRKPWLTRINPIIPFKDFIHKEHIGSKYIAHCYEETERVDLYNTLLQTKDPRGCLVLIGPEGDFSVEEVHQAESSGYQSVSLGTSRLRTETAGLSAVMMSQLVLRTS